MQTKTTHRGLAAVLLFALLMVPTQAMAWWDKEFAYRTKVTVDLSPAGAGIADPVGRTQVLVRLHAGNFSFKDVKDDGADIRAVASDDKTPLKFHIEKFDGLVDEVALLWVDVSDLVPGQANTVYLYYGNPKANPAGDSKSSFGPDQALVWHFDPKAGAVDATSFGNNSSTPATVVPSSLIAAGARLDGKTPLQIAGSATLATTAAQAQTVSLWVKPAGDGAIFTQVGGVEIGVTGGVAYASIGGARAAGGALAAGAWSHVAAVTDGKTLTVYVNGVAGTPVPATLAATSGAAALGTGFAGEIDQLEIDKAARPAGWIKAAALSQGLGAKLLKFDAAEANGEAGGGYFGILLASLTPDGWAVIGILFVMFLMSIYVMYSKATYINRVARANKVFLERYNAHAATAPIHGGLQKVDGRDAKGSSLARLFEIGRGALASRVDETDGGPHALAPQSIAAIRAQLDAGAAREGQKLNNLMVLLTIAISGGPFLGLLGTVVGVMITFAAIAAAGDVNINSIAPGIAAALLATVAGLAVAIPALFGYNYLLSRIDAISVEMQIFVDELEKRIAETYRGVVRRQTPAE